MSKSQLHHVALDNSRRLTYELTSVFVPVTPRAESALKKLIEAQEEALAAMKENDQLAYKRIEARAEEDCQK